jgi:flagellar biosynthesis/type III secretory pathway protein FliH
MYMYTFLPAMKGATAPLLLQAVREMQQYYSRYQFGRHLARFKTILQRSTMVSEEDKQHIEEELHMEYDSLIDENPEFQQRFARKQAEGKLQGLQEMVLEAVKDEYPPLVELAQEKVVRIRKPESLRQLVKLIYKAPDENTARWLLNNFAA